MGFRPFYYSTAGVCFVLRCGYAAWFLDGTVPSEREKP
jgi:hypothetical protein